MRRMAALVHAVLMHETDTCVLWVANFDALKPKYSMCVSLCCGMHIDSTDFMTLQQLIRVLSAAVLEGRGPHKLAHEGSEGAV